MPRRRAADDDTMKTMCRTGRLRHLMTALLAAAVCASCAGRRDDDVMSLCSLQRTATEGSHRPVVVSGIFFHPVEDEVLLDPDCPERTAVEFADEFQQGSDAHREEFRSLVRQFGEARVVLEGEFYGPPAAARTAWGRLNSYPTKIVVRRVRKAERVPGERSD